MRKMKNELECKEGKRKKDCKTKIKRCYKS